MDTDTTSAVTDAPSPVTEATPAAASDNDQSATTDINLSAPTDAPPEEAGSAVTTEAANAPMPSTSHELSSETKIGLAALRCQLHFGDVEKARAYIIEHATAETVKCWDAFQAGTLHEYLTGASV